MRDHAMSAVPRAALPPRPGRDDAPVGTMPALGDATFAAFQELLLRVAGISLASGKKALVAGRLAKRLRHLQLDSFDDYRLHVALDAREREVAIDLLTTNETRFFREAAHFELLRDRILPLLPAGRQPRVWSAAASSGQEPYSIAMVLAAHAPGDAWEVFASDLSARVLEQARRGQYPLRQADEIPRAYLEAHCLRGVGAQEGTFAVAPALARRVRFAQINLNGALPDTGLFDVIFLRNVLIYFPAEIKRSVVQRLAERLQPGGWLLIGHSESLSGLSTGLKPVAPSVYRRP